MQLSLLYLIVWLHNSFKFMCNWRSLIDEYVRLVNKNAKYCFYVSPICKGNNCLRKQDDYIKLLKYNVRPVWNSATNKNINLESIYFKWGIYKHVYMYVSAQYWRITQYAIRYTNIYQSYKSRFHYGELVKILFTKTFDNRWLRFWNTKSDSEVL